MKGYKTDRVHGCRRFRKVGDYWLQQISGTVNSSKELTLSVCAHYAVRYPEAIVKCFKVRCRGGSRTPSWKWVVYWIHPHQMRQQDKEMKQ